MWNFWIQQTLVFIAALIAILFLVKKFFIKPKKNKNSKSCGNSDCGCH